MINFTNFVCYFLKSNFQFFIVFLKFNSSVAEFVYFVHLIAHSYSHAEYYLTLSVLIHNLRRVFYFRVKGVKAKCF